MSQDESLRLAATVVDGFTGPLKSLRTQMQGLAREGAGHTETLEKSFGKVTGAMRQAETAAASGLNPALKTVGITSLTATAAILGVGAAMRSFVSGAASLGVLSRETGQTAENLRNFGAVASKFGVDQEAVAAGTKSFAGQMREFGRGIGDTYQWLNRQGRDAGQRRHFQDFAADLRSTTDRGEQLRKVLAEMENIKDPVERGMFAEKFFGNTDFGRLGDKHFGPILEMWKKTAQKLGPLDPAAVESAERFERSVADLGSSMRKLGTAIGQEVLPYAERFTTWLSDVVSDQRGGAIAAIRENLSGVKRELDQINWTQFGKDSLAVLKETTSLAGTLAVSLHRIAEALRAFREDRKIEAFRHLDGASGPLARRLAPLPGDDKIERDEQADVLRGKIGTAQEQGVLQAELLKELQERGDKEGVKRLTDAMELNARQLKALQDALGKLTTQGGATVQQQSLDGSGFGGGLGSLIQKAAFGGGGGYGGTQTLGERLFGRPTGANAAGDPYRQRRMDALRNDPSAEWRLRIRRGETGVPLPGGTSPGGGAGQAGRALRGGQGDGLYGSDGARGGGAARVGRSLRGEDGPTADIPGALNPRLAGARKKFFDELDQDPVLRERVMKTASLENGRSASSMTNVIESMVNRGMMNGQTSFKQVLGIDEDGNSTRNSRGKPNSFYGPIRRGGLHQSLSERHRRMGEEALKAVRDGSNTIGYRTDQGMLTDPGARIYMQEADRSGHRVIGGENFFYMGRRGREWARQQEAADRDNASKAAPDFAGFLKRRSADGSVFGQREDEPIQDKSRRTVAGMNDDLARGRLGAPSGEVEERAARRNMEAQGKINDPAYKPERELTLGELYNLGPKDRADGRSFDTMYKARQETEDERRKALEFRPAARNALQNSLKGGAIGASPTADGALDVRIHNPGPNTRASVDAKGGIFRSIQHTRGRQMQAAGEDV